MSKGNIKVQTTNSSSSNREIQQVELESSKNIATLSYWNCKAAYTIHTHVTLVQSIYRTNTRTSTKQTSGIHVIHISTVTRAQQILRIELEIINSIIQCGAKKFKVVTM